MPQDPMNMTPEEYRRWYQQQLMLGGPPPPIPAYANPPQSIPGRIEEAATLPPRQEPQSIGDSVSDVAKSMAMEAAKNQAVLALTAPRRAMESVWESVKPYLWGPREAGKTALKVGKKVANVAPEAVIKSLETIPGVRPLMQASQLPGIYAEEVRRQAGGSMQIFPPRPKRVPIGPPAIEAGQRPQLQIPEARRGVTPAAVNPSPAATAEIAAGNPITGAVTAIADQEMNRNMMAEATGSPRENVPDVVTQPLEKPGEVAPMEQLKLGLLKEENTRRRRIQFLEGMRDMAEGFGNIRVPTGYPQFDNTGPYIAETTRRQIAREEDKLSAGEASMLGKELGIAPEKLMNVPASRLKTWFPSVMAMKRTQEAANIRTAEQSKKREDSLNRMVAGNVSRFIQGHRQDLGKAHTARIAKAMLAKNNEVGDWAAVTLSIRGSGDNRINEGDISRWAGRTGVYKKLTEFLHRQIHGRMSNTLRAQFQQVLDAIESEVNRYVGEDTKLWAGAYGGLGTSAEEYQQRFSALLNSSMPDSAVINFKDEQGKAVQQAVDVENIDSALAWIRQHGGEVVSVGI